MAHDVRMRVAMQALSVAFSHPCQPTDAWLDAQPTALVWVTVKRHQMTSCTGAAWPHTVLTVDHTPTLPAQVYAFGTNGIVPPADEEGFMSFLRALPDPEIYNALLRAEPLTPSELGWAASMWVCVASCS